MGTPAAERQRRSRKHRAGDHSLCDPSRCDGTTPVTADVTSPPSGPPGLGTRGRRLWREVTADGALQPGEKVLLEEACRIADRLDKLDKQLRGDEDSWMRFHARNEDGSIVRVVMTGALAEARQQATALKQLLTELRAAGGAGKPALTTGKVAGVADLAAFAATRSAKATG